MNNKMIFEAMLILESYLEDAVITDWEDEIKYKDLDGGTAYIDSVGLEELGRACLVLARELRAAKKRNFPPGP